MDLNSTLIRAEALFKRFQRLVDAVDKKGSFPAPRARLTQGGSGSSAGESGSAAEPAAAAAGPASPGQARGAGKAPAQQGQQQQQQQVEKVITPELRGLLSRQVEVLPRKEVRRGDGGVGGARG